jgi:hypothetical protein
MTKLVGLFVSLGTLSLMCGTAQAVDFSLCGGMICVPVKLADGKTHKMLFDTGNVSSWVRLEIAQEMRQPLEPYMHGDKPIPDVFRMGTQSAEMGGKSVSGKFLAIKAGADDLPPDVDGALAYTLFEDQVVELDYPKHVLTVGAAARAAGEPKAAIKLITFGKNGPPIVTIEGLAINGHALTAQYDTGFTGTLVVYDEAAGRLGLAESLQHGQPEKFPYTDGGVTMNASHVGQVTFGSEVIAPKPATIYVPGTGANPVHQPDGLFEATVGNALFAHSVVTFDFPAMTIYVRAPEVKTSG